MRAELGYSQSEWDALHWDERVTYLNGLAQLMQIKFGGGGVQASSSPSSTVDEGPQGLELLAAMGGQVRTEEVSAE